MELIHDEMRETIIEAARKLTREKHGEITVRDILKELGTANRVFYNRFRNIGEVMDILYAETVHTVRTSLAIPWDGTSDFFGHIMAVGERTVALSYESRGDLSALLYTEDTVSGENYIWWEKEIRQLIRRGKETGNIKNDLDETAVGYAIWCFIRGFCADAIARKLPLDEALARFVTGFGCLLDGIRA